MDSDSRAESADDLCRSTDEVASSGRIKNKRPSVIGRLKGFLGHKKKRSRAQESKDGGGFDDNVASVSSTQEEAQQQEVASDQSYSSNHMSMSVDSIFSPEDHNLPTSGIIGMKNTSASLEALSTGSNFKSELERKLINRRSLDDDGLPGSPIGTPTPSDVLNQPHFLKSSNHKGQEVYRTDRDSDGSLLSIGSSENEEDAFFKNPWKGAHTSAIRRPRRGTVSSDSESDDTLDFDAVTKTESLSNAAAMHKRNVRPKHRAKSRRVIAAPAQMPSVAEKKTLEIAHTFLDEGERTPVGKLRTADQSVHTVTVRRTDSDRTYNSPKVQKRAESAAQETATRSPRPVSRSATTHCATPHRHQGNTEEVKHQNELLSVFQKRNPPQPLPSISTTQPEKEEPSTTSPVAAKPTLTNDVKEEEEPPPRPAKTVGFTGTPPLQRRNKPPIVQPRPKSMFPQQVRSKTQEIQGSNVEEALNNLTYSKSFNLADSRSHDPQPQLRHQQQKGDNTPEWAKLAKRKTWVVSDTESAKSSADPTPAPPKPQSHLRPVPVPRLPARKHADNSLANSAKSQHNELNSKFNQINLKLNNANSSGDGQDSYRKVSSPLEERPLLYSPTTDGPQATRANTVRHRKTSHDDGSGGSYGFYSEKVSPSNEQAPPTKETIVMAKPKPIRPLPRVSDEQATSGHQSPLPAQPPWKASLKQRTGSLKVAPATNAEVRSSLSPPNRPSWKSATLKEKKTPPSGTTPSADGMDDRGVSSHLKSKTLAAPTSRKPNPMTVSDSAAYNNGSAANNTPPPEGDEPKSFNDRLKMFQKK